VAQHRIVIVDTTTRTKGFLTMGISYYCRACHEEWADFGKRKDKIPA